MEPESEKTYIAFAGSSCVAKGPLVEVARAAKQLIDDNSDVNVLAYDAATSRPVEIDFRGSIADVLARLAVASPEAASAPRSPGRPKLGVVAREVTLLPRHWEWLATQPGGASATLRRLVERARKDSGGADRKRVAQDATYRFTLAMAGDKRGFEEATRALYAGDEARFRMQTEDWPADVRDHARALAVEAFAPEGA